MDQLQFLDALPRLQHPQEVSSMLEYIEEGWGRGSRGGVGGGVDREGGTRVTLTRGGLRNL